MTAGKSQKYPMTSTLYQLPKSIQIKNPKARSLVSNGEFVELAELLSKWLVDPKKESIAENILLDLLAIGKTSELSSAIKLLPDIPLALNLFMIDADIRVQAVSPSQLHELFAQINVQTRIDFRLWLSALIAERSLWQGELVGLWSAQSALAQAPDVHGRIAYMARGRLKRLLAVAAVLTNGPLDKANNGLVQDVILDLEKAQMYEEMAATVGLIACIKVFSYSHECVDQLDLIREVIDQLDLLKSDRKNISLLGLGWAAGSEWDFQTLKSCVLELENQPSETMWPVLEDAYKLLKLYSDLYEKGPSKQVTDFIFETFKDLRESTIRFPSAVIFLSSYLLDIGETNTAERLAETVIGHNDLTITFASEAAIEEIDLRIRILKNGEIRAAERMLEVINRWKTSGRPRQAAKVALRAARDCSRAGLHPFAEKFRSIGVNDMPPKAERTPWENWLIDQPETPLSGTNEVKIMGSDLVVMKNGRSLPLTDTAALLLTYLVLERKPVTTSWLMEQLWPGENPEKSQNRLKVLLFRLRKSLDLARDELISRDSRGFSLDPAWSYDYIKFMRLIRSDPESKLRALREFPISLCSRQFRYNDEISWKREEVHVLWRDAATWLVDEGMLSPEEALSRAREVDLQFSLHFE